ncbi:MAG: hypothetical protein JOZ96_12230 [Acidobacteria bacterium]|nr:hypothetical protein [Acidobacteriota bacterium]
MRGYTRLFLACGLLLLLCQDCLPQQKDVVGWEGARWGMSEAELLKAFNGRLRKLPERKQFFASYAEYVIPGFKLGGEPFTVFFQMDKGTDKLAQIIVRLDEQVSLAPRERLFNSLDASLARAYGRPGQPKDERYTFRGKYKGIALTRTWKFPTTTVELSYGWDDQIYASLLVVRYFPRPTNARR